MMLHYDGNDNNTPQVVPIILYYYTLCSYCLIPYALLFLYSSQYRLNETSTCKYYLAGKLNIILKPL